MNVHDPSHEWLRNDAARTHFEVSHERRSSIRESSREGGANGLLGQDESEPARSFGCLGMPGNAGRGAAVPRAAIPPIRADR